MDPRSKENFIVVGNTETGYIKSLVDGSVNEYRNVAIDEKFMFKDFCNAAPSPFEPIEAENKVFVYA